MSASSQIVLKPRYYLDHFREMIGFVREKYEHAFEPCHLRFLEDFDSMGTEAQCLYVRFVNRKGRIFHRKSLRYEEIEDFGAAVSTLREGGFVRDPDPRDFADLLTMQTRPTLVEWIRAHDGNDFLPGLSSAKKRKLVSFASAHLSFDECFSSDRSADYLVQERLDEIEYLLFLYFGKLRDGLTSFALRDLGVVEPAPFRSDFEARFESREVALVSYHYEKTLRTLDGADEEVADRLFRSVAQWPDACDSETEQLRSRALRNLGRLLERRGHPEDALTVYLRSDQFPSTERAARLLVQMDRREEAARRLEAMIDDPSCDEELLFAEDFYARKFQAQRLGRLTSLLRSAGPLELDESGRGTPEAAAVRHFRRRDIPAWHTENVIWHQLFGLVFWDLLYGSETAALHNSFEWKPRGLDSAAFLDRHRSEIEARLDRCRDAEVASSLVRDTWEACEGTPNAFVAWHPELLDLVLELITRSPPGAVSQVLGEIVQNPKMNRRGFPDLMLVENDQVRFVEIKTEGDHLQRHQLAQLERLRRAGYDVAVRRVVWMIDPEQDYVVVDVETTGGNPQWNRVTEIGAVKVRNGRIIDEWSTLLNPGRRIPRTIVSLTGITDEMVADAPRFEDVADEFREFVDGAVFVAHRAKFDHGFIRAEYERLEEDFRLPTLCTVVASRRYFPGLKSYGLARLCEEFAIPLESHHRALCDARATTQILLRINEQRIADQA